MKNGFFKTAPSAKKIDAKIIQYVIDRERVTSRDVAKKFNLDTGIAGKKLNYLSNRGILNRYIQGGHRQQSIYSFNGTPNKLDCCRVCGSYAAKVHPYFGMLCKNCTNNFLDATKVFA